MRCTIFVHVPRREFSFNSTPAAKERSAHHGPDQESIFSLAARGIDSDCTSARSNARTVFLQLELHNRQARHSMEVTSVQRRNIVAEMQRGNADKQVFEG